MMTRDDIIGHLADWYNVNGEETFDQAKDDGIIIPEKSNWKLKEQLQEGIENQFGPPASQAFSDTGNNPHIELEHEKLGKPFNEKSDTGDDKTRTGPGGLLPRDDYNSINYHGLSDTKVHIATPYQGDDAIELHNVSGIIPELQTKDDQIQLKDKGLSEGSLTVKKYLKFKYNSGKIECKICKPLDGMEFAQDDSERPVLPSEKLGEGVFNTHPNCLCTWEPITKYEDESLELKSEPPQSRAAAASLRERDDITNDYLTAAKSIGTKMKFALQADVKPQGLQESLSLESKLEGEFDWVTEQDIKEMSKFAKQQPRGKFLLAVVSGDSYTDHRIEGEDARRHWTKEELMQNIRTGKGKLTDINHLWEKKDMYSGFIYDANWNFKTDRGEMVVWEGDEDILIAIKNDIITAVSINTGKPREITKVCDEVECVKEPRGTVLGEENGRALAFIVTHPNGFQYNGQHIPAMPPGMKFTKIYIVD